MRWTLLLLLCLGLPAQADLEQVVGEEFGVDAGAGHTGLAEDGGSRTDGVSEGLACTHTED